MLRDMTPLSMGLETTGEVVTKEIERIGGLTRIPQVQSNELLAEEVSLATPPGIRPRWSDLSSEASEGKEAAADAAAALAAADAAGSKGSCVALSGNNGRRSCRRSRRRAARQRMAESQEAKDRELLQRAQCCIDWLGSSCLGSVAEAQHRQLLLRYT